MVLTGCSKQKLPQNQTETGSLTTQSNVQNKKDSKTLIVYYSYSGTTKRVAEHLQSVTGGDLYELTLKEPYSGSDNDVSDRVFAERRKGKMPELSGTLPDLDGYDRVFIGTPVWNSSMANPILSFLEKADFGGKTVALFWTYITNQGRTKRDFSKQARNAVVADGLPLARANGISDDELDNMLKNWADNIG